MKSILTTLGHLITLLSIFGGLIIILCAMPGCDETHNGDNYVLTGDGTQEITNGRTNVTGLVTGVICPECRYTTDYECIACDGTGIQEGIKGQ